MWCKWPCMLKKLCSCSVWMWLRGVNTLPSKPPRTFGNPTLLSSFPFLKSDCKQATRLLPNDCPRSDVWAVNHVRFHTDRRRVHTPIPSALLAWFRAAAAAASRSCEPWQGGFLHCFIPVATVPSHTALVVVAAPLGPPSTFVPRMKGSFPRCSPSLASPKALGIGRLLFLFA